MPEAHPTPPDAGLPSLPGYEILDVLGQGGQGTVVRARQKSLNRVVAIKILAEEHAEDRAKKRRFLAEARLQSKLHHPNILQGIDINSHEGWWFFVMEFVSGRNGHELIRERGRFREKEVIDVAQQVAEALSHAFERGIVHGDIKPENLVLSHDGTVKMVDFGIARLAREERRRGPAMGTEEFMAPEVKSGKSTGDIRSDLFSLGVTMWEMLSGSLPPLAKATPSAGPDIRKWEPEVSKGCASVLQRLLALDPKHRPKTPKELMAILSTAGASTVATKVEREHARAPAAVGSRRGVLIPVLSTVGLVIVGVVLWAKFGGDDETPTPTRKEAGARPPPPVAADPPDVPDAGDPVEPPPPEPAPVDPVKPPPPDPDPGPKEPVKPPGKPELIFDPPRVEVREGDTATLQLTARNLSADLQPLFKVLDSEGRDISARVSMPKAAAAGDDPNTLSVTWTAPWFDGHAPTTVYVLVSQPPAQERLPVLVRDRNRPPEIVRAGERQVTIEEGQEPRSFAIGTRDADGDEVTLEIVEGGKTVEATIVDGSLLVRARDLPGTQGGTPERIVVRGTDGHGGTDVCELEVIVDDLDHPARMDWDLGDGPWKLVRPADPSQPLLLSGPERPGLNASLAVVDPDVPEMPLTVELRKDQDRAKGLSVKRKDDGAYRVIFRNPPRRGWGPTEATLLVTAEGQPEKVIDLRIQVLRRIAPPPESSKDPVDLALAWLRTHQLENGSFPMRAAEFRLFSADAKDGGAGQAAHRPGVAALAVVAALRAGDGSPWVKKALGYLLGIQDGDGCVGARGGNWWIYNHAIATEALALGWHLLGDPVLKPAAGKAAHFLAGCRNRGPAGAWRYGIRPGNNDTSVTVWCVRALATARMAGITVDAEAIQGGLAWIASMMGDEGRIGYSQPGQETVRGNRAAGRFLPKLSESLTAAGLSVLVQRPGFKKNDRKVRKALALVTGLPCAWTFKSRAGSYHHQKLTFAQKRTLPRFSMQDFYYWQHATYLFRNWKVHLGGKIHRSSEWRAFSQFAAIHQRRDGTARGSWDPTGAWGTDGGRSYATAIMAAAIANVDFMDPFAGEVE